MVMEKIPEFVLAILWVALAFSIITNIVLFTKKIVPRFGTAAKRKTKQQEKELVQ